MPDELPDTIICPAEQVPDWEGIDDDFLYLPLTVPQPQHVIYGVQYRPDRPPQFWRAFHASYLGSFATHAEALAAWQAAEAGWTAGTEEAQRRRAWVRSLRPPRRTLCTRAGVLRW